MPGLLAALAAERQRMPHLARQLDPFVEDRTRPFIQVLQRGVARGEVDPETDLPLAASLAGGALLQRVFFGGATDRTIGRIIDMALRAIEPR